MQTTVLFKAPGRRSNSPIVILTGPAIGAKYSTPIGVRISRALSAACNWVRCSCTPRNILRALFCEKVSMAVAAVLIIVMWWHNISIDDNIAAGKQVATDCLYAMPWGIVWAIRATINDFKAEKGGKA